MKNALIVLDELFQDAEAIYPFYRLQEAGYSVDLAGVESGKGYVGKHGYTLKSTVAAKDITMEKYDILIIPGGWAPDKLRRNKDMVRLTREAIEKQKIVGAICHAGWLLVEADVIRQKRVTGFVAIRKDLENAGGLYEDKDVVVDGKLVTSRTPEDLPAFLREILQAAGK